ncbi:MAG: lipocalin family protein [Syntrophales bacterium]
MISRTILLLVVVILLLVSLTGCMDKNKYPPLSQVSKVEISRYLGLWYEIARIDHSFQKGCVASTAQYSLRPDGYIKVVNQCRKNSLDGKITSIEGRAWVIDKDTNAWLKVQFFWPFRGDYVIIDLDEQDYSYAVVGHPSRDYLWVLSRSPEMNEERFQEIMIRISKQGYDLNRIKKYPQIEIKR